MSTTLRVTTDGAAWAEVEYHGTEAEPAGRYMDMRTVWRWAIGCADDTLAEATDLRSGCGSDAGHVDMLDTLGDFLGAFAEARRRGSPDSECWGMFPDEVAEVAEDVAEAIREACEHLHRD